MVNVVGGERKKGECLIRYNKEEKKLEGDDEKGDGYR